MRASDAGFDAKGLNRPVPILTAKKARQSGPAGALLEIHATDPGAVKHFCRSTGNELVISNEEANVFKFVIEARARPLAASPESPRPGRPPVLAAMSEYP